MKYKFKYLRQILRLIDIEGINLMVSRSPVKTLKYSELCEYINKLERDGCVEFCFTNPRLVNHLTDKGRVLLQISEDYKLLLKMREMLSQFNEPDCDTIISVAEYVKLCL